MEDDSKFASMVRWGLGAVGLGGVAAVITVPKPFKIWVAVTIIILFVLFFGGYLLWRRIRARRQSRMFSSAIEAQTAAAPRAISDPNQRAALDKLRQKFQTGMQEFKSRGKDIYKLPWYVIIGESGSGKSEAIRHSGIEFPPGLQDEMQGSGGTVNMDWWFTNRAIILDTAGSMIFRETQAGSSPEWGEFLRLLKKSRPLCPINGLFLVLSVESLINDSADKISEKASRLAQQLQLIQRTLDVRFPVYLLVTKADLLTGFRDFFDNIEDPLLQHQMFGWSNPDSLDSQLRPELVEQHLKSITDRLRRRRLALLLRETSSGAKLGETSFFSKSSQPLGGHGGQRRLDDFDALFALPESVMRLVPRLRRYLETVFVAGEWSAKPVFLRGIYFTSSMREGKALDEAMALATGLSVDELPEDRSWEKNRAFFLRDLFVDKVFCESGLVTRATNTIQLLRKRQFAIFGTAGVAMLLLLVFGIIGRGELAGSVGKESKYWEAGTNDWNGRAWSNTIVRESGDGFAYAGTNLIKVEGEESLTLPEYHYKLKQRVMTDLPTPLLFLPLKKLSRQLGDRKLAQRILFEQGVIKPLVDGTRKKIQTRPPNENVSARLQGALLALILVEADRFATNAGYISGTNAATNYLNSFISYLTDSNSSPVDTNLVDVFVWTYSKSGSGHDKWPPTYLLGGDDLTKNVAIRNGLDRLREENQNSEKRITEGALPALNALVANFVRYQGVEQTLLNTTSDFCRDNLLTNLDEAQRAILDSLTKLHEVATNLDWPLSNLSRCYEVLANQASAASALAIESDLKGLSEDFKAKPLYRQITNQLQGFKTSAAESVRKCKQDRLKDLADLDANYVLILPSDKESAYMVRWGLFLGSCNLTNLVVADEQSIGKLAQQFGRLTTNASIVSIGLTTYRTNGGPFAERVLSSCSRIMGPNADKLKKELVTKYAQLTTSKLSELKFPLRINAPVAYSSKELVDMWKFFVDGLDVDLNSNVWVSFPDADTILGALRTSSRSLSSVANGLVNSNDVAQMEIIFNPRELSASEKALYAGLLRFAKVVVEGKTNDISGGTRPGDVSSFPLNVSTPITPKIPVSAAFRVEFFSDSTKQANTATFGSTGSEDEWTLILLIKAGLAEQINNKGGKEWRLNIPVTEGIKSYTLKAFEIRVSSSLPKKEDWLQ